MVEFFQNIGNWFIEHKTEFELFLSSTSFAAIASVVTLIIKQIKATKTSNTTVSGLSETLVTSNNIAKNVTSVSDSVSKTFDNSEFLKLRVNDLEKLADDRIDVLEQKIDAILEVQSIVYSSMKDEIARKNVFNLLTGAKLLRASNNLKLQKQTQIVELQAVQTQTHEAQETKVVEKDSIVEDTKSQNIVSRY
jgi:conjugal transfer/entry exclusion protein